MVSVDREAGAFQAQVQKREGPYNSQTLSVRCGQLLIFVNKRPEPVVNGAVTSLSQFL